ncbi:MAG: hypothetical protein HY531_01350, partial [Chloroflexi bacterium]|nr:hypothetical protein [Chloroflexota bacterium]
EEDNPDLLTIVINGKLVLSQKDFDPQKKYVSTIVNLSNQGINTIVVNMKDKGALEPDPNNPLNLLMVEVVLDQKGPALAALATIYPFTAIAATPGDPVVYQVNATDAETGVAKVEIFASPGTSMFASAQIPKVLRDQWGTTGTHIFPTVIPAASPNGALTLLVKATDLAGNVTMGSVIAEVVGSMNAWNSCWQRDFNQISLPIIPTNGAIADLLTQIVPNVNPAFTGTPARLSDVVQSISYWTGGRALGDGGTGKFLVYAPGPAFDDLSVLKEGRSYFVLTNAFAFLDAPPLPGFTQPSRSCMNMTVLGRFLTPGDVPPVFPVKGGTEDLDSDGILDPGEDINGNGILDKGGWNMVGRHSEEDSTVDQFLAGVTFPERVWTSLLTFKNAIEFDYANKDNLPIESRVTSKLGTFESRFKLTDPVLRGEGFWLFVVADGVITP